jgi:hypothetical protein
MLEIHDFLTSTLQIRQLRRTRLSDRIIFE